MWRELAEFRSRHGGVRWLSAEKLHLTLVFLGQTDSSRVSELSEAVARVAAAEEPFRVVTGSAGGRVGARRGGVAWLRLADGGHEVARLSIKTDDAIRSQTYDARNAPRPHLTVARRVDQTALADLQASAHDLRVSWIVDRIVLFRSHTGRDGSRYEELFGARFGA